MICLFATAGSLRLDALRQQAIYSLVAGVLLQQLQVLDLPHAADRAHPDLPPGMAVAAGLPRSRTG